MLKLIGTSVSNAYCFKHLMTLLQADRIYPAVISKGHSANTGIILLIHFEPRAKVKRIHLEN
jgi:hypothetical protein